MPYINEVFSAEHVPPETMDELWSKGWRHFGQDFFRYSVGIVDDGLRQVIPLRIRLDQHRPTKSQRRNLRRNADLICTIRPFEISADAVELFDRHRKRFTENVPSSLLDFLPPSGNLSPCEIMELRVERENALLAMSYFSLGRSSTSGIYAMFEPAELRRGLGIFTLLKELEYAKESKRDLYYLGYSYDGRSFYDYKKQFSGTEAFDWSKGWYKFRSDVEGDRDPI